MNKNIKRGLFIFAIAKKVILLILLLSGYDVFGQKTEYPMIGAQVFVEPGQSAEEVRGFMRTLKACNMTVCRMRMFEDHMKRPDGTWDFTLYDAAFDEAARQGIKVFATVFPSCDPLDLGGFKFPSTEGQLKNTAEYIRNLVTHYKDHPAMYAWVLQNEPGTGKFQFPDGEFPMKMYDQWLKEYKPVEGGYSSSILKLDFNEVYFLRYLTSWYLKWLHDEIARYDDKHFFHVNPHQLFETLPEYDFPAMEKYLTSLGASMHMSWHFDNFRRDQFPLGVSLMSDIIRSGAGRNPFWITELQGGNVTFSGRTPMCPTREEIAQWLWTGVAAGSQGVIFWTLNSRSSGIEAGEWGMVDYQRLPTDRLVAASEVAAAIQKNKEFFPKAEPVVSGITIVYNVESFMVAGVQKSPFATAEQAGRTAAGMPKSLIATYEAFCAFGISPDVKDMDAYDWEQTDPAGKAVIMPNVLAISSSQWPRIKTFVRNGGRLIATGMTGYYDEYGRCTHVTGFPLKDVFGAELKEYKYVADQFDFTLDRPGNIAFKANMWRGTLALALKGAKALATYEGEVTASVSKYGKGDAVWIPSPVGVGAFVAGDSKPLTMLYGVLLGDEIISQSASFADYVKGVFMRTMRSGDKLMTVIINKSGEQKTVSLVMPQGYSPEKIFGSAGYGASGVTLSPEECVVYVWRPSQASVSKGKK